MSGQEDGLLPHQNAEDRGCTEAKQAALAHASLLLQLAERAEREEPSARLDQDIWAATKRVPGTGGWKYYTSSLDSAMTLTKWCIVTISDIGADGLPLVQLTDGETTVSGVGTGKNACLAIVFCAASLRALAHEKRGGP